MTSDSPPFRRSDSKTSTLLILSAWFGLVTGLTEGLGLLVSQTLGWLEWYTSLRGVWVEIIWISPLVDLSLFGGVGLGLAVVSRVFPRLPMTRFAVFLFGFMGFVDLAALTGRIRLYAVLTLAAGLATVLMRSFRAHDASMLHYWRRSLPYVVGAAALALVGIQGGLLARERLAIAALPQASPESPNILLIVLDTVRADHLLSYGYPRNTSPNIDLIARHGVVFANAFATSSWSPPSHASFLTGRFPYEHGVEWNQKLDGRYPTLPELLQSRGYRTGAFSANTDWFSRRWGFGRGFIRFEDYFYSVTSMFDRTVYGHLVRKYGIFRRLGWEERQWKRADSVNRSVLRWVQRDREKPFLAVLNYMDAHFPYSPPEPYSSRYSNLKNPDDGAKLRAVVTQSPRRIDDYDAAISYLDDQIGHLVAELETLGFAENILIVITSDHGELFGEQGLFGHRNALHFKELQVPLIFRWTGHVPAGVRVLRPVTNAAIPPTVMELIGYQVQTFPGPSLSKLWETSGAGSDWPVILSELAETPTGDLKKRGWVKSLVSPQVHYVVHEKLGIKAYDWKNDPEELHNLAGIPEIQATMEQLRLEMSSVLGKPAD